MKRIFSNPFYTIFLIGVVLRVYQLIQYPTLQFDEAVVWNVSTLSAKSIIAGTYYHFRFHPPLFYLLIHFWRQMNDSEIFLRFPSLLSSIIAIPVLFFVVKQLVGKKAAFIAMILYSVSSFSIYWAIQLRVYSLLFLWSLVFVYFFNLLTRKDSWKHLIIYIVVGSIGFHLDYSFIWIFLTVNFIYILKIKQNELSRTSLVCWVFVNTLCLSNFIFYIYLIGKETLNSREGVSYISSPQFTGIIKISLELLYSERIYELFSNPLLIFYLLPVLLIFSSVIFSWTSLISKNRFALSLVFFPITSSFIISQFYPIFIGKNLFIISFGLLLLLSNALKKIHKKWPIFPVIFLFFWAVINMYLFLHLFKNSEPEWKKSINIFSKNNYRENPIVIIPTWFVDTFKYYSIKFNLLNSTKQILTEDTFSIDSEIMTKALLPSKVPQCVVYNRYFEDDLYTSLARNQLVKILESYPDTLDLTNGVKIYCR